MIWIQVLGVIGILLTVYGCMQRDARQISKIFAVKNLIMTPHYFVLGAYEAMYIEFISSFRNAAVTYAPRKIMTGVIVVYLVFVWSFFLYKNPETFIDVFSAIGTTIFSISGFFRHKIWFYRGILCFASTLWIIYFAAYSAWFGMSMEFLVIGTIALASMRDLNMFNLKKRVPASA